MKKNYYFTFSLKYDTIQHPGKVIYHFCAGRFLPGIQKQGIRLGSIPTLTTKGMSMVKGYQWLTTNEAFQQSWTEGSSLPYDRTEYRLTIMLPKVESFNLFKWSEFGKDNLFFNDLNSFGDSDNWWVFKGVIIPYWIANIEKKR